MFARMPKGPSSAASARISPSNPVYVAEHRHRAHAGFTALRSDGLELVAIAARVQHEIGALGRERERDGAPDVAAGARDERGLAIEPQSAIFHAIPPQGAVMRIHNL